jgi:hypothetical protein
MTIAARSIVPLLHVADVPRSVGFYERLGFVRRNAFTPEGETTPTWAWLDSEGASLMVARGGEPVAGKREAVLFYLYCDDVAAAREACLRAGIEAGPIASPFYAPRGEFRIEDPDGYVLMITHT